MTDAHEEHAKPPMTLKELRCRRTGQMFTTEQHAECPYCFASIETIEEGGEYERFCGYDAEKDPISFGFPPDSTRTQRG